jgi:carbon monoxide dehydrogenase subunit G
VRIAESFEVRRPVDEVWTLFQDVPSISRCLPGSEPVEDLGDGRYRGAMSVRVGPIGARFDGEATVLAEPEAKRATITGNGIDKRGGSRGQAVVTYALLPSGDGTHVAIEADVSLAGPAAQFGRTGLLQEISRRLIAEFSRCLEAKLAAATPEEAGVVAAGGIRAESLLASSIGASIKRTIGRDRG